MAAVLSGLWVAGVRGSAEHAARADAVAAIMVAIAIDMAALPDQVVEPALAPDAPSASAPVVLARVDVVARAIRRPAPWHLSLPPPVGSLRACIVA